MADSYFLIIGQLYFSGLHIVQAALNHFQITEILIKDATQATLKPLRFGEQLILIELLHCTIGWPFFRFGENA